MSKDSVDVTHYYGMCFQSSIIATWKDQVCSSTIVPMCAFGGQNSFQSQNSLLSDLASDGRWLIRGITADPLTEVKTPWWKSSSRFVKEYLSCHWWRKALQAIVDIEALGYWGLHISVRLIVLHMLLKGTDGTAGATSSAKRKDLPLVHRRNICVHITPEELKKGPVLRQETDLVKHTFNVTTYCYSMLPEAQQHTKEWRPEDWSW